MKSFLFSVLFAGAIATIHAEEQQCYSKIDVDVLHGDSVVLLFRGQSAKDIFNAMPKSSKLSPKESCYTDVTMKVQGGFVCFDNSNNTDPPCAYLCELEVSAETGKVFERSRNDRCEDEL